MHDILLDICKSQEVQEVKEVMVASTQGQRCTQCATMQQHEAIMPQSSPPVFHGEYIRYLFFTDTHFCIKGHLHLGRKILDKGSRWKGWS